MRVDGAGLVEKIDEAAVVPLESSEGDCTSRRAHLGSGRKDVMQHVVGANESLLRSRQ